MEESILDSTKPLVGIEPDVTAFDLEIITHINSVFASLNQLGIGPPDGFAITGATEKWTDYLGEDAEADLLLNSVKTYMALYVRFLFDPPKTSFGIDAVKGQIDEFGWRLNMKRENELWPQTP